jgi:hypothetical protein
MEWLRQVIIMNQTRVAESFCFFKVSQMAAGVVEEYYALMSYVHMFKERICGS